MSTSKKGKKNRKYGRGLRKPSHNRYTSEQRWKTNKAKKIAKQKRKEAKAKAKAEKRRNS